MAEKNLTILAISDEPAPAYSTPFVLFLWLLTISFSTETIVGNLLVLVAYKIERSIRMQLSSHFIVSLAVSDLIIGMEGFPFLTLYVLENEHWPLGKLVCNIWLWLDYTLCLVSIFTVLLITVDRYLSVCYPAKYRQWQTLTKVQLFIVLSWLIPALLFGIMIFGWSHFTDAEPPPSDKCYAPFLSDPYVNMSLYIVYYWTILITMSVLYRGIHLAAKQLEERSAARHHRTVALMLGQRCMAQVSVGLYFHADVQSGLGAEKLATPKFDKSKLKSSPKVINAPNIVVTDVSKRSLDKEQASAEHSGWPSVEDRSSCPLLYVKSDVGKTMSKRSLSSCYDELQGYDPFHFMDENGTKEEEEEEEETGQPLLRNVKRVKSADTVDTSQQKRMSVDSSQMSQGALSYSQTSHKNNQARSSDQSETTSSTKGSSDLTLSIRSNGKRPAANGMLESVEELASLQRSKGPLKSKGSARKFSKRWKGAQKVVDSSSKLGNWMNVLFNSPASILTGKRKITKAEQRARRAFRTITIIVGAFALFWSPYYIVATIYGFCPRCIPNALFLTSYYLCYLNSSFNPFAYAFANRAFRRTFLRVLQGDLKRN